MKSSSSKTRNLKQKLKQNKENNKKIEKVGENSDEHTKKLLENAKHSLYSFEYDLALKFCQRVLEKEPHNIEALDLQGCIYTEIGDVINAKNSLKKSLDLNKEKGSYARFMSLGQLSIGKEAVEFYHQGIKAIQDFINQKKSENSQCDVGLIMKDLSNAYLQLAELYLTDECSNEEAEELCKTYLEQSLSADATNTMAYNTFASYYISLNDIDKAKKMMNKGLEMWLPRLREIHQSDSLRVDDENMLDASCRINCCKTLIELEEYDKASEILEFLLDENEQLVEAWYLLAWLNYLKGEGYQGNVKWYMNKALELATATYFEDEAMVQHMKEVMEEMKQVPDDNVADDDDEEMDGEDEKMEE